jgi:Delta24-sterol reductase
MTRPSLYRSSCRRLDISKLNQIVAIDVDAELVITEPGVSMERLVRATLLHGLVPQVVPEFRGITVGGALVGGSLESSSHRFGQFSDTCLWCEVLLGSGERLRLSQDEHADLFHALPGSYGTLAIVTLVALKLAPAGRSVRLRYNLEDRLPTFTPSAAQFVEGMLLRPNRFVTIEGEFVNKTPTLDLHSRMAPWFYQHVYEHSGREEILSTVDYLFRFDRGAFWMGQFVLHPLLFVAYLFRASSLCDRCAKLMQRGPSPRFPPKLMRLLFSHWLTSRALYAGWHAMPALLRQEVLMVQDISLPLSQVQAFVEYATEHYRICPLWFCPVRRPEVHQPFSPHCLPNCSDSHVLNIGLYGAPSMGGRRATLDLEEKAVEMGGRMGRYSQCYLNSAELWKRYDHDTYRRLREIYRADEVFCDLESKLLHA